MLFVSDWLVVPGARIGGVAVGADPQTAYQRLGRARFSDSAMQKSWSTWIGQGGGRIDVFSANDAVGTPQEKRRIHVVRATSPSFHLKNGLRPGSSASRLRRAYPRAKAAGRYAQGAFWDDVRAGLAWEVRGGKVAALIVHDRGKPLTSSIGPYLETPLPKGYAS